MPQSLTCILFLEATTVQCVFRDFARNTFENTLFREHFVQLLVSRMNFAWYALHTLLEASKLSSCLVRGTK